MSPVLENKINSMVGAILDGIRFGKESDFVFTDHEEKNYFAGLNIDGILTYCTEKGIILGYKWVKVGQIIGELAKGRPVIAKIDDVGWVLVTGYMETHLEYKNNIGEQWGDSGYGFIPLLDLRKISNPCYVII